MVIVVLWSKASESCCRSEKVTLVHLEHASVTPGNTEYTNYSPLGMQNSRDALAKGIFCTLFPFSQNVSVQWIRADIFSPLKISQS
jgi:hypothetical protein